MAPELGGLGYRGTSYGKAFWLAEKQKRSTSRYDTFLAFAFESPINGLADD